MGRTASKPKITRQVKTDRQRAEETLGVAERKHAAAVKKRDAAKAALVELEADVVDTKARLDYVSRDPALPSPGSS